MKLEELSTHYNRFKYGEENFHRLMRVRVRHILLVSTFYDAYIFEHDGQLSERVVGGFFKLNLVNVPQITVVPTGQLALSKLKEKKYDLVVTTIRIGDINLLDLTKRIRALELDLPIVLLLTAKSDIAAVQQNPELLKLLANVFLWTGDSKLFVAMVKCIEDQINCPYDTSNGLVGVLLLVEDSIDFRSLYLPLLYEEIMFQTQRLISEEVDNMQRYYRMRARPKVLLTCSYEGALEQIKKYEPYLLGIISDIRFSKGGKECATAGYELLKAIKQRCPAVPVALQSSEKRAAALAQRWGIDFIDKSSPTLSADLRAFFLEKLGFGDFVFKDREGKTIQLGRTLSDLEEILKNLAIESLLYHSEKNHFSNWLIAHGELKFARKIQPLTIDSFPSKESARTYLMETMRDIKRQKIKGKIVEFNRSVLGYPKTILRIGTGSLGGKGRGLAFLNALMATIDPSKKIEDLAIEIPQTIIVTTEEFDWFIKRHKLFQRVEGLSDQQIRELFLSCPLSSFIKDRFKILLKMIDLPLAVRSSGLLEDSQAEPFAGIYSTYMIPNNHPDEEVRLGQLCQTIKLVYASIFLKEARSYIQSLSYRIQEEKMAVIVQVVAGELHGRYYYPHFSGVARSRNFYPVGPLSEKDCVASLAVGLGQLIVEGERCFFYSPVHPASQLTNIEEIVRSTQTRFYAIDCANPTELKAADSTVVALSVDEAEKGGVLVHLASVWDGHTLRPNLSQSGPRVIDFANIVKYDMIPLNYAINQILTIGERAMGTPVELEFAVTLGPSPTLSILQIRPMGESLPQELPESNIPSNKEELLLVSHQSLGHGVIDHIHDIIYLDPSRFDRTQTLAMRDEIESFNSDLQKEEKKCLLVAPGRWGTRDISLGIPVNWRQICQASAIVEVALTDYPIDPSSGSHFLLNIISMKVGYFYVSHTQDLQGDFFDWEWVKTLNLVRQGRFFSRSSLPDPLLIQMNGNKGLAYILKKSSRLQ